MAVTVLRGNRPMIFPLRSIEWRGEGRGEVRFGAVDLEYLQDQKSTGWFQMMTERQGGGGGSFCRKFSFIPKLPRSRQPK
jgi:hypothetical protein